jgi:LmbE family N-acetylglucosaminyl deacetylase
VCVLGQRLFVVAAHPDDDAIGCGGAISIVARAGGAVCVSYLTDGSLSHPGSRSFTAEAVRDLREAEAIGALAQLGVGTGPVFFRLPDSGLATLSAEARLQARRRLAAMIEDFQPDLILAPWRRDPHSDHVAAGEIALDAARDANYEGEFAGYQVWLPIRGTAADLPRAFEVRRIGFSIDAAAMAAKRRAILAHRSQTTDLIDDPSGFRIGEDLLERWVTSIEPLLYEHRRRRPAGTQIGAVPV